MKALIFTTTILMPALASSAEHNHLECQKDSAHVLFNCMTPSGAVTFENDASNDGFTYEMDFTVQADFACPGNFQSGIELKAGAHNPGHKLRFGSETVTITGQGPVILQDTNSKLTLALKVAGDCSLSFQLKDVKPSAGQKLAWKSKADLYTSEINDLMAIYQSKSTILFWDKKAKTGDQKIIDLVTNLRDDTKTQSEAAPWNMILSFRLAKYNEILDNVPSSDIKDSFNQVLDDIKASLERGRSVKAIMDTYGISVPEGLTSAISSAEQLTQKENP